MPHFPSTLRQAALVLAILLAATVPARGDVIDRVLAIVDGTLVTLSDVRAALVLQLVPAEGADPVEAALDRWIDRLLVLQEVERFAPPEPSPEAVHVRLADVLSRLGPPEARRGRLQALGVTEAWLRGWVRDDLRIQAYVEQRFSGALEPTSEELENYVRANPNEFDEGRAISPADAQAMARTGVMAARRRALVTDWVQGLRRRAEIVRPAR
jgi:hypothetical protein